MEFQYFWMLLLLPLPWLLSRIRPPRNLERQALRISFSRRVHQATSPSMNIPQHSAKLLPYVVWVLLLLAIMKPQRLLPPREKELPTRDLMMLVDLSGSMTEEDFTNESGSQVSRLEAVKEVGGDFLERRKGDRVGLIVFGDAPYVQVPFTTDLDVCRQLLEESQVGMAGPKTALGDAIGLGLLQFEGSEAPSRTLIALTDGNDSASQVPPVEAARVARDQEVRIHCIAIGDPEQVGEQPLDEETLKQVAASSGGQYFFAGDRLALEKIYEEIDRLETRDVATQRYRPKQELYPWPLAAALLVWFCSFLPRLIKTDRQIRSSPVQLHVDPRTGQVEVKS